KTLVVGLYDDPRTVLGTGTLDHFARGQRILGGLGTVPVIFLADLEVLVWGILTFLEAPELFVGRDVQPELDDNDAAVSQLVLEVVDLLVASAPLGFDGVAFDPLAQHAPVPAAIVDGEAATPR